MGKVVMVLVIAFMLLFIITASMGCDDQRVFQQQSYEPVTSEAEVEDGKSWFDIDLGFGKTKISDQPPREFKEKCEIEYKSFHFFKNANDDWACKLPDGRVLIEGDAKPRY